MPPVDTYFDWQIQFITCTVGTRETPWPTTTAQSHGVGVRRTSEVASSPAHDSS